MNQSSRCNTQEGLLSVAQTGDSDLLGGRAPRTANWASFLLAKKPYYQHITYGLQGDWLHVCKAVLLVQTSRATLFTKQFYWYKRRGLLFKLRRLLAFQLSRGLLLGAYLLAGSRSPDGGGESHHFTETETQVPAACQPHIIKLISQLQKPTRKISDT